VDRRLIIERIDSLADNPRPPGAFKLSGLERYRIRQGRYRILYTIEDSVLVVHVIKIGDRKNVYRSKR
jgi:mRNA interferase RelE/StbE